MAAASEEPMRPVDDLLKDLGHDGSPDAGASQLRRLLREHMAMAEAALLASHQGAVKAATDHMRAVCDRAQAEVAQLRQENELLRQQLPPSEEMRLNGACTGDHGQSPDTEGPGASCKLVEKPVKVPSFELPNSVPTFDGAGLQVAWSPKGAESPKSTGSPKPWARERRGSDASQASGSSRFRSLRSAVLPEDEKLKDKIRWNLMGRTLTKADIYTANGWSDLANSTTFDNVTISMIVLNAAWIAWETDNTETEMLLDAGWGDQLVNHLFCLFFTVEWVVRFMSYRRTRYAFKDAWFVFDTFLLAMMIIEVWLMTVLFLIIRAVSDQDGGGMAAVGNLTLLRILRLVRMSRTARIMRLLRLFPELMVMVKGMTAATRAVSVTLSLLLIIIFIFGIAFTQMTSDTPVGDKHFGNVPSSMNTLIGYGIFMEDAPNFLGALWSDSPFFYFFFLLFALLASFTVLNMLIGVMVETVRRVSVKEQETSTVTMTKEKLLDMLVNSGLDADGDHHISKAEFSGLLAIPECARALQDVGVDPLGLVDLSEFVFEKKSELDFDEFMETVMQLRGTNTATVKDLVDLRKYVGRELERITLIMDRLARGRDSHDGHAASRHNSAKAVLAGHSGVRHAASGGHGAGHD